MGDDSVIHQIAARVTTDVVREDELDRLAAALFLRAQASWLRRGLRLSADPTEVEVVLGIHDSSHESWVSLIAAVEHSLGDDAAQLVSGLYSFHGRVAGSLERGLDVRIEPAVRSQVREMLAMRLTQMTQEAVTALGG